MDVVSCIVEFLKPSKELQLTFKQFYDKFAREAKESMTTAKRIHRDYMLEIEKTFRRNGFCHHLEYMSNSGEAVREKMADDDTNFDVLMVIDRHEYDLQVLHDNDRPGYAWLKLIRGEKPSSQLEKVLTIWDFRAYAFAYIFGLNLYYVDPEKTIDIFIDELRNQVKTSVQMKGKVDFNRRGLAIRMDVYLNSGLVFWGKHLYSVDLVPAYQVDGVLFVPKPLKEDTCRPIPKRLTWRRSFSFRDKQDLSGGAKCVFLALEAVRNHEPGLAPLTSNHIKRALVYEMDTGGDWSDRALVQRFFSVLDRLESNLIDANLPQYFIPFVNMLIPMTPSGMRNMRNIIQRIRSNENELIEILRS